MLQPLVICALVVLLALPALAADYSYDFTPQDLPRWSLHQAGAGRVLFDERGLSLDLTSPTRAKQAAAELKAAIRVPLRVQWEQQLARDSDHCYSTGVYLADAAGHTVRAGLGGKPLGHTFYLQGGKSAATAAPEAWYAFALTVSDRGRVGLTVTDSAGKELWQSGEVPGGLQGAFVRLGFFHNQTPAEGLDEYDQDRGLTLVRRLRLSTPALLEGDLSRYRDAAMREGDNRTSPVFNRAMRWLGPADGLRGAVLAYDEGEQLWLTGEQQVASWLPNRLCAMRPLNATTCVFTRPNDLDGYDRATLRAFQWCVRQRPLLRWALTPRAGKCYLKVCLIEPYLGDGIELWRTPESAQPTRGEVDLGALLRQRGMGFHQFGEIAVYLYQDRPAANIAEGAAELQLSLTGPGALVTTAPVVVSEAAARAGAVPVYALVTGREGRLLHDTDVRLTATVDGRRLEMYEYAGKGFFEADLRGLPLGEHEVALEAVLRSGQRFENKLAVSVTGQGFYSSPPGALTYSRDGKPGAPLLGDLYSWVPVLDADQPTRRLIVNADEWRKLSPAEQGRVRLIKQRSLTPAEIHQQLAAHRACGFGVIRLAHNVSFQESYLDAGGHVSPHGLETLALVLRECRSLGLTALLNLFHYPYGSPGTGSYPPWQQYVEAGYEGPQSFTSEKTWPLLTGYLGELLACLRNDPAVLGYSLTGENDQTYGPDWINRLYRYVTDCDPRHLVTLEQGGGIQSCPGGDLWHDDVYAPRHSGGLGYRTYYSEGMKTDAYDLVCARFYRGNPPAFLAEDASGPGWYPGFAATWTHPDFLTEVRDDCWASLLCQQTMCLTWSAPWTQEERLMPRTCADLLDWSRLKRRRPEVAVVLKQADRATVSRLALYEAALAAQGIDYDYLWEGRDLRPHAGPWYRLVLDARKEFTPPAVPAEILAARPLVATAEHSVSYLLDDSGRQFVASVRNTAAYRLGPGYGDGVNELHRQRVQSTPLSLTLQGFAPELRYRVYDLDERRLVREGRCADPRLDLGETSHDFAVVVYP